MTTYDLCLAWNWEYDADFVALVEEACRSRGLSVLQVTPDGLASLLQLLADDQAAFRVLLDRASDTDRQFLPLVQWADEHAACCINPHQKAAQACDKAYMHWALINAGLYTPYTIVLPPYAEQPDLPPVDLSPLGQGFAIKPAHGWGGEGAVIEATSLDQVLAARREIPADTYLLQAHAMPVQLDSRPAWFRVIYCTGQVYPCWWDPTTHRYTPVTQEEQERYSLAPLWDVAARIARLCELDLFSTGVSLTGEGLFTIVDYVNDQIDLRLQSRAFDGVPDDIVHGVAGRSVALVQACCVGDSRDG
jgi:hypothetical protein